MHFGALKCKRLITEVKVCFGVISGGRATFIPQRIRTRLEIPLSITYLLLLVGVASVMLAVLFEAVLSVSTKPKWAEVKFALAEVETVERRTQALPFVGTDRRAAQAQPGQTEELKKQA